jgi:hypothetical protein
MSKIPSINSLHKEKSVKEEGKFEIFNIVLNKCIEKIVYSNRHTDKTYVIFEVPKILIGYPMYDMRSCILFLMAKLSQHGYLVEFMEPFYLYIDWRCTGNKSVDSYQPQTKLQRQTNNLLSKFPNASKIEFVYEDTLPKPVKGKKKQK